MFGILKKPKPDGWVEHATDSEFARIMRRGIRSYRREKGRQGHRFRYDDLLSLYSVERGHEVLVVVTHNEDKLWQFHHFDEINGWTLESWHKTEREAKAEAEKSKPKPRPKLHPVPPPLPPGIYLYALWPDRDRPITLRCSSSSTAEAMTGIFERLGYVVETKEVVAA